LPEDKREENAMSKPEKNRPARMLAFTIVWAGQMVSMLGTGMTRFALTIWAWQVTGEATALALVGFFSFAPLVLFSPFAGALVDRWNRKLVMMLSDLAAGLATIAILLLFVTDNLQIWHLYLAGAFAGTFEAFQFPAYSAAVSTMLPKSQYTRANGMLGLAESVSHIAAPLLAGFLLVAIDLNGILVVDIVTFLVAIGTLLLVHIPQPVGTEAGRQGQGNLWQESLYGFRYIIERPSLLGLQLIFSAGNFIGAAAFVLLPALILARTGNNEVVLGSIQSIVGIGGVIGGVMLSIWGGPKRRIHMLLLSWMLAGLLGELLMGLGQTFLIWGISAFCFGFFIPLINGSNQAIWQAKVVPDVQGRVFAARRMIAQISSPVAMLLIGPAVDYILEPAMMPGGGLAATFGALVGTGPGAGLGLMFAISGFLIAVIGLSGYTFQVVRYAEDILPDHDTLAVSPTPAVRPQKDAVRPAKDVEVEGVDGEGVVNPTA
jgi:MFS family permease